MRGTFSTLSAHMSGSGLSRVRFCVSLSRNHKDGLVRSCSSSCRTFASSSQSSSSTSSSTSGNTNTSSQHGQAHGAKRPELFPKGIKVQKYRCETPEELLEVPPRVLALPHVAVAGRTNVGKSSLLNMLLRKDNLARASSVQNKTRSVDFLCVNNQLVLTDLPGYPDRTHNKVWDEQLAELVDAYLSMSQATTRASTCERRSSSSTSGGTCCCRMTRSQRSFATGKYPCSYASRKMTRWQITSTEADVSTAYARTSRGVDRTFTAAATSAWPIAARGGKFSSVTSDRSA